MAQRVVRSSNSDRERALTAFEGEVTDDDALQEFRKLDDDEVKAIVGSEIKDAIGSFSSGTHIAEARRQAMRLYLGKPFGNEVKGRSQVVMTETADTIHWILPSLMRMFTGNHNSAQFSPSAPRPTGDTEKDAKNRAEAEMYAEEATAVINHLFREECHGFEELFDGFFTALLEKRAYFAVGIEERVEPEFETMVGLTHREFEAVAQSGQWEEVIEYDERVAMYQGEEVPVIDAEFKRTNVSKRLALRGVPPEEFMIARRERRLNDDSMFCGERRRVTSSELISWGYSPDLVRSLPSDNSIETESNTVERRDDEMDALSDSSFRTDLASRTHWINDCYIRVDQDGDGYSEMRRVVVAGELGTTLLSNERAKRLPFATLTAFPLPYKHQGLGIADLIGDLQKIKSTLWRQMLDNIYLQNNQRHVIIEGAVEVQDLLTSRPGGIIRANMLDAVRPLEVAPMQPLTIGLIDKIDEVREIRTGVTPNHQGIDAAALKGGATGVAAHAAQAAARIELIGRIFAETGVKDIYRLMYQELRENGLPTTLRIGEKWVEVDPSKWPAAVSVRVNVGLGVGAAAERISYLMAMLNLQQQAIQMGATFLASPRQVYKTLSELTITMGYEQEDRFFSKPGDDAEWPSAPPDPRIVETERKAREDEMQAAVASLKARSEDEERKERMRFNWAELEWKREDAERERESREKVAELQAQSARTAAGESDAG